MHTRLRTFASALRLAFGTISGLRPICVPRRILRIPGRFALHVGARACAAMPRDGCEPQACLGLRFVLQASSLQQISVLGHCSLIDAETSITCTTRDKHAGNKY